MAEKSVRVVIEGRVQGVFFRAWTVHEAEKKNLRGWVRNRLDGTVEAVFSGPEDQVDAMIQSCRRGPPAARIDNITQSPVEPPDTDGFGYLPTD